MPSAWTQNFYHTVFSTKGRAALITPELEARLYPFLGGILRDLRCTLLAINGMSDHVHLLIRYRADLSHSEMLQQIKGRSSKGVHETFPTPKAAPQASRLRLVTRSTPNPSLCPFQRAFLQAARCESSVVVLDRENRKGYHLQRDRQ